MAVTAQQLNELEAFFKKTKLPKSIALDEGTMITDVGAFIQGHLFILRNSFDKSIYDVFYARLLKLKEILSSNVSDN